MNYGYILPDDKYEKNFSLFRKSKIKRKEIYQTSGNILISFYLPHSRKKSYEEKTIKKLIYFLKQYQIEYIAFAVGLSKYTALFREKGFYVIDGSAIKNHLLAQGFFAYLKTNRTDTEKTGIHLCANNMKDIDFFFDRISKINTVFSMCTENESYYSNILKKYGIAVHFSDNVSNKIIIYHSGEIPRAVNSHTIGLSSGNYKITCSKFPNLFPEITPAEAELLLRMNYSSCDSGFYDSGIKITCF